MSHNRAKYLLDQILMFAGLSLAGIVITILIVTFFSVVLAVVSTLLVIMFVYWLCGGAITVTKDNYTIGHIRWFKYTEVARPQYRMTDKS